MSFRTVKLRDYDDEEEEAEPVTEGRGDRYNPASPYIPQDLYFQLDNRWREWFEGLQREYTCARCGLKFKNISNIGSWKCKQHAREWNSYNKGEFYGVKRWDCCGSEFIRNVSEFPRACVPSDHSILETDYEMPYSDVVMPQILFPYIKFFRNEAIIQGDKRVQYEADFGLVDPSMIIIRRFNDIEHASRYERGRSADRQIKVNREWVDKRDFSWFHTY